jgi:hypothetical protein
MLKLRAIGNLNQASGHSVSDNSTRLASSELELLRHWQETVRRRVCLNGKRLRLRVSERHRQQVRQADW